MASVAKRRWSHNGIAKEAWECRYFDQGGKRRSKSFTLKKDADAFKRKVEREIEDGTHTAAGASKSINDVIEAYLADVQIRLRDGRIGHGHAERQGMVCRIYIAPAIGKLPISDLRMQHISDIYTGMLKKGLHPRTGKQYLNTFHMVEVFARKREWLKTQPVADALSELRGLPAFEIKTFKPDEITILLSAVTASIKGRRRRTTTFMSCAVSLAALCGLRVGEILGLQANNVDFEKRLLRIRHNLTNYGVLKGPKTRAGIRDIPIPDPALHFLEKWRDNYQCDNDRNFMFSTSGGKAYCYFALHENWKRLLARESLERRNFHALRHFYASWLLRHGMPVADVSKMIGHSSHDMTLKVYTHALLEADEAVEQINRIASLLPTSGARVTQKLLTA